MCRCVPSRCFTVTARASPDLAFVRAHCSPVRLALRHAPRQFAGILHANSAACPSPVERERVAQPGEGQGGKQSMPSCSQGKINWLALLETIIDAPPSTGVKSAVHCRPHSRMKHLSKILLWQIPQIYFRAFCGVGGALICLTSLYWAFSGVGRHALGLLIFGAVGLCGALRRNAP